MASHSFTFEWAPCPLPVNLAALCFQSTENGRRGAALPEPQGCKSTTHSRWWLMKDSALFAGQIHSWVPEVPAVQEV